MRRFTSSSKPAVALAGLVLTGLAVAACGSSGGGNPNATGTNSASTSASNSTSSSSGGGATDTALCGSRSGSGSVTVGYANFAENQALAAIYAAALDKCGYTATTRGFASREIYYPALIKNQIQVVPDYAATLTDFINQQKNGPNAASKASGEISATMRALRSELPSILVALDPATATDKNAFAVTKKFAQAHHLTTLSQLGAYSRSHPLMLGGPPECPTRPFCEPGLKKTYGMKFSGFKSLDAGGPLTLKALQSGTIDVGLVFTSDPTVAKDGLVALTDDKKLQASDNIVPVVAKRLASGAAAHALNAVQAKLDEPTLIKINQAVEEQHAKPELVASEFLKQEGLG